MRSHCNLTCVPVYDGIACAQPLSFFSVAVDTFRHGRQPELRLRLSVGSELEGCNIGKCFRECESVRDFAFVFGEVPHRRILGPDRE